MVPYGGIFFRSPWTLHLSIQMLWKARAIAVCISSVTSFMNAPRTPGSRRAPCKSVRNTSLRGHGHVFEHVKVPVCFCRFSSLLPVRSVLLASRIGLVDSKKVSMWLASCTFFLTFSIFFAFCFLIAFTLRSYRDKLLLLELSCFFHPFQKFMEANMFLVASIKCLCVFWTSENMFDSFFCFTSK